MQSERAISDLFMRRALRLVLLVLLSAAIGSAPALAAPDSPPEGVVSKDGVSPAAASAAVPGFWDPRRRPERPDLSRIQSIRFLTELDYPPFDYAGTDGNPAGFNVDLARLLCTEINTTCTVQARRFDLLLDALNDKSGGGDAVIASIAANAD